MAKKAKSKKKHHRRKRGGVHGFNMKSGGDSMMNIVATVAGAVGGSYINNHLLPSSLDDKIKSVLVVAGGLIGVMVSKPGVMKSFATGVAVAGGLNLTRSLVPGIASITEADISGIEDEITIEDDLIQEDVHMISGSDEQYHTIGAINDSMRSEMYS